MLFRLATLVVFTSVGGNVMGVRAAVANLATRPYSLFHNKHTL
jgi:hypothetical protein